MDSDEQLALLTTNVSFSNSWRQASPVSGQI
jgi:hypothetical protein